MSKSIKELSRTCPWVKSCYDQNKGVLIYQDNGKVKKKKPLSWF